jgi:hypothetical protein
MARPNQSPARRTRILWFTFSIGFAISLIGAAVLFTPTLEFAAADLLEKLGLPTGIIASIVVISDYSLFIICAIGLIVMGLRLFFSSRPRPERI